MSRGAAGAALGAAGATVYLRPDILINWVRNAAASGSALTSREVEHLSKLVEELSREVRGSRPITVVRTDGHNERVQLGYYVVAAVGGVGLLYLTTVRGWRWSDLAYVSQRTFRQGISGLSAGLDSLANRLADLRARFEARIAEISRKQDEAAAEQAGMRAHLADVGHDVEVVRGQVGQVHAAVMDIDGALTEMSANQRHALQGIYVLVKAVSELAAGSNIQSKQELLEFTQSPIWQRLRPQGGLEGVLSIADNNVDDGAWPRRRYAFQGGAGPRSNEGTAPMKPLPSLGTAASQFDGGPQSSGAASGGSTSYSAFARNSPQDLARQTGEYKRSW